MKKIYLTLVLLLTVMSGMQAKDYDIIVAQDGSGDYKTVQEAINAVPDFRKEKETRIFIRNGVYKEKLVLAECKLNVTLIGESAEGTILTYDDFASKPNIFGENKGTSGSSSFYTLTTLHSPIPRDQWVRLWRHLWQATAPCSSVAVFLAIRTRFTPTARCPNNTIRTATSKAPLTSSSVPQPLSSTTARYTV